MRAIRAFFGDTRGTMVAGIAKAGAMIALLSVVAANIVSTQTADLDRDRLTQVASAAGRGQPLDPLVTGSLQKNAAAVKLDPCVVQKR